MLDFKRETDVASLSFDRLSRGMFVRGLDGLRIAFLRRLRERSLAGISLRWLSSKPSWSRGHLDWDRTLPLTMADIDNRANRLGMQRS